MASGAQPDRPTAHTGRAWLGLLFECCHAYGRIYRSADGTRYEGRCPRCGAPVSVRVGPGGTPARFFRAG